MSTPYGITATGERITNPGSRSDYLTGLTTAYQTAMAIIEAAPDGPEYTAACATVDAIEAFREAIRCGARPWACYI